MSINEHESTFAGKPVVLWDPNKGISEPESTCYRISVEYEDKDDWEDRLTQFLADPAASRITALVVGTWSTEWDGDASEAVAALVAAQHELPALRAVFVGDITSEEQEISWIKQADVSPLLEAYPQLEILRVRGGEGLTVGPLHSEQLKTLIVEAGGLDASIVEEVIASHLPALEHLELWLGTDSYGATTAVSDLVPLFTKPLFPRLRYLGLRDSDLANEIAVAVAQSTIMEQIRVLDLSLGVLDDTGLLALQSNPALFKLQKLDIHHHYCTADQIASLASRLAEAGVAFDGSEPQLNRDSRDADWRFVAVGE